MFMKNLRFNRIEKNGRHLYMRDFSGNRQFPENEFSGFIKCKLVHGLGYSIVLPDQIYMSFGNEMRWIQPLFFMANAIAAFEDDGCCDLNIDISFGAVLQIRFWESDLVKKLDDGSIFYKCSIKGPKNIYGYTTGAAIIRNGTPYLKLYHHTNQAAFDSIKQSSEYWSSNWNIQGTKKSTNISYFYLTALSKISSIDDLEEIAMSSNGKLRFRVDSNFSNRPDLVLDVYRDSTDNRSESLESWVQASLLASQPCYRHTPPNQHVYYAIVSPYIHRVGVSHGSKLNIMGNCIVPQSSKAFEYVVIGDATNIEGLQAPYDEENTKDILKVEFVNGDGGLIDFWMQHQNSSQFENKSIEMARFG